MLANLTANGGESDNPRMFFSLEEVLHSLAACEGGRGGGGGWVTLFHWSLIVKDLPFLQEIFPFVWKHWDNICTKRSKTGNWRNNMATKLVSRRHLYSGRYLDSGSQSTVAGIVAEEVVAEEVVAEEVVAEEVVAEEVVAEEILASSCMMYVNCGILCTFYCITEPHLAACHGRAAIFFLGHAYLVTAELSHFSRPRLPCHGRAVTFS